MSKINRNNILEHLVEKHLNIIRKTTLDALFYKNWKNDWKISQAEYDKFKKYSVNLLKRVFKCNRSKSESTFDFFYKNWGLKIK